MKFRDLNVGDTFDWIDDSITFNSFFLRCVKLSTRTYTTVPGEIPKHQHQLTYRVGTINADVFHVQRKETANV